MLKIRSVLRIALMPVSLVVRFAIAVIGPDRTGDFTAKNVYVVDGDTLHSDGRKIRIYGIDAPEMGQGQQGELAKRQMQKLVGRRTIRVEPITVDHYGRSVARVFVGKRDIGKAMVAYGYAVSTIKAYHADAQNARRTRAGLYGRFGRIEDPVKFRRKRRTSW